jgi:hypothetical protein
MRPVISSLILAVTAVATIAVGVASANFIGTSSLGAAPKGDRLPVAVADASGASYVTVETRPDHGVSVLNKIQIN